MRAFLLLLISCGWLQAIQNPVYVAQSNAGSNNGTSCANAYAATFFNTVGNWGAGASQIGAGTTVHLCGTVSTKLTAHGSGTNGSPITITFETGATISLPVCDASNGCLSIANLSYIVVDGGTTCGWIAKTLVPCNGSIQSTTNGSGLVTQADNVGIVADSCANCEIRNLLCANIYQHTSATDATNGTFRCVQNLGGTTNGSTFLLHNLVMHDVGSAVSYVPTLTNDNGLQYYNNYVYNDNSGIDISNNNNGTMTAALIHDNYFGTTANWDSSSPLCFAHHNSLHSFGFTGANGGWNSGIQYYNNWITGNWGTCPTGGLFMEGANRNSQIFNNFWNFTYTQESNGIVSINGDGVGGGFTFVNNTIIGTNQSGDICFVVGGSGDSIRFENNIVGGCGTILLQQNSPTLTAWNFNTYGQTTNGGTLGNNGSGFTTLGGWQAGCSCDANSTFGGTGSTTYLGVSSTGSLNAGSPAIGAGTNLTTLAIAALDSDPAGVARPGGSTAWDAGAYQFASTTSGAVISGLIVGSAVIH